MKCRIIFSKIILLLIAISVSQITSKDITFHDVVIKACVHKNEITILEGERIRDFIPTNCSSITIRKQNMPILFESSFGDMAAVRLLLLDNNSISEIRPGVFTGSSNLHDINLENNKIEEVKAGVFNNFNISTLSLAQNSISKIDSNAFDNMPSLKIIDLYDNKIGAWDSNWFRNSHALIHIFLANNEIKYLPSKGFEAMLENMEVQRKDDARGPYHYIGVLSFINNQINSIENDFLDGIFTYDFVLSYNNIECFQDVDLQVLTENFGLIQLYGNPMKCDCVDRLKNIADLNNKTIFHDCGRKKNVQVKLCTEYETNKSLI